MNKKKMIELFVYVVIVVVGIILLITSNTRDNSKRYGITEERSASHAVISDQQ